MVKNLNSPDLDQFDLKLLSDVYRHGWHVVQVPEQDGTPGWSFSVGFRTNFDHPDLVIFGLPGELGATLINALGEEVRAGRKLVTGERHDGLLEGYTCTLGAVVPRWYEPFLGYALWYYEDEDFEVLQILWPDKDHRFPFEPEFNAGWAWMQPLLDRTEPQDARAVDLLASIESDEEG